MQPADVLSRSSRPPDLTLSYGSHADHVADLWLPPADASRPERPDGQWPLILFLHGGFWRAAYDRRHAGPLAEALAADGFAVCCPEYRRVGQDGGGWPGTFDDIRSAVAVAPGAVADATDGRVDAARVVLAGHSAGGHLALWAASRPASVPETVAGAVVSLAGVCDLTDCYRMRLGDDAARDLMGGGPGQFPERYAVADPSLALPLGLALYLVHGTADDRVPWEQSRDFGERAQVAGDRVRCVPLPGVGHFELIDPLSAAWPAVEAEFRSAADGLAR
jgi:acetyl esterase/lipase